MKRPAFTFKQYLNEVVLGNWGYNPLLKEELTDYQKEFVDTWGGGGHLFSYQAMGGESRITIPLKADTKEVIPHPDVKAHLENNGYSVADYRTGTATDKYGREVKIGKVLNKTNAPQEVKNAFENDPQRAASTKSNLQVVISKHPYDVAGMSTDRGWTSCMNMAGGCNRHFLYHDVRQGTHVAYLTQAGDDEAANPIARIALKPYIGRTTRQKVLYPEDSYRPYGAVTDEFKNTVRDWTKENFPMQEGEIYDKDKNVYDDSGVAHVGTKETMLNSNSPTIREEAFKVHKNSITPEDIENTMADFSWGRGARNYHHEAMQHPAATEEQMLRFLPNDENIPVYQREPMALRIAENPSATDKVLREIWKQHGGNIHRGSVRSSVAENKNASPELLHDITNWSIANNTWGAMRESLIQNPNLKDEDVDALWNSGKDMQQKSLQKTELMRVDTDNAKPRISSQKISELIASHNNDPTSFGASQTFAYAMRHPNISREDFENLHAAMMSDRGSSGGMLASYLMQSKNHKRLSDNEFREAVVKYPYSVSNHHVKRDVVDRVMNIPTDPNDRSDEMHGVVSAKRHAMENENASLDHIRKGMADPHPEVALHARHEYDRRNQIPDIDQKGEAEW